MKKIYVVLALFVISFLSVDDANALNGTQIMHKTKSLKKPATISQSAVLLILKGGRKDVLRFNGIFKDYGFESRMRIEFNQGSRMKFLVVNKKNGGSLQWLKLSSGRIRQVPRGEKANPWLNSHFYNIDIGGARMNQKMQYKLLGEGVVDSADCYRIESRGGTSGVYSKSIIYVGKNDFVVRRVEFFERGLHTKTLTMYKIKKISGIYTPRKIVMKRTDGKGKSIIYIKTINYNVRVADSKLKRSGL